MTTPQPGKKLRRFLIASIISMILTMALTIVLLVKYNEDIVRYMAMRQICSDDPETHERGLYYLYKYAPDDPAVRAAADRILAHAPDQCFDEMVQVLSAAGVWGSNFQQGWRRLLVTRIDQLNESGKRFRAVELYHLLRDHPEAARDPRLPQAVEQLLNDESANVRYNALYAAALLAEPDRSRLIVRAAADPTPDVAYHAWLMLASMNSQTKPAAPQRYADLPGAADADASSAPKFHRLANAILYAAASLNLKTSLPEDPNLPPEVRAFIPYALKNRKDPPPFILESINDCPPDAKDPRALLAWRAILSVPLDPAQPDSPFARAIDAFIQKHASAPAPADPLLAAAYARRWPDLAPRDFPVPESLTQTLWSTQPGHSLRDLARLESLPTASIPLPLDKSLPPLPYLHLARISTRTQPDEVLSLFDHPSSAFRDVATLTLIDRLDPDALGKLSESLIFSFTDEQRMAGALLAAMTHPTARARKGIENRVQFADQWLVLQHYLVAKKMLNLEAPGAPADLAQYLIDHNFPHSTLITAMLWMGNIKALDHLLNPIGQRETSLTEKWEPLGFLFDQRRFITVLKRFVPDLPDFWTYADPDLQQFQIDLIRDWYLLHRDQLSFNPAARQFRLSR